MSAMAETIPLARPRAARRPRTGRVLLTLARRRAMLTSGNPRQIAVPLLAILPFFFAGALFPISAMPGALAAIAKAMPLTHALALMRYGFLDHSAQGLHDIWGMSNVTAEAWLSLAVVAVFAAALTG